MGAQTRSANKIVVNVVVSVVGKGAAASPSAPVFTPSAGAYVAGQQIALNDAVPGATIYYTTDGSVPSINSPVYSTPLILAASETIQAMAAKAGVKGPSVSASFTVTPPHLVFSAQPEDVGANQTLGVAPAVSVIDGNGVLVQTDSSLITLSLATNPGGANLNGTVTATTLHGVATFPNLSITTGGAGDTLSATSPGITSSVSTAFNVTSLPSLTIALPSSSLPVAGTLAGTFTLSQPAAVGGTTLTLASSSINIMSVSPAVITIPAGHSTGAFTLTGNSPGPSTLSVSTSAYSTASAQITIVPAAPVIMPAAGIYPSGQQITLSDIAPGAAIHYTTDGTVPTAASPLYSAPLALTASETISTVAVQGTSMSAVTSQVFEMANIKLALTPASANLYPSQTQAFSATVSGSTNTAVTWSLSPALGTISEAGLYTATAAVTTSQSVTVIATSAADPTKFAIATLMLSPLSTLTLSLPSTSAPVGGKLTANVSLSQPPATGGVVVSLTSSSSTAVTVLPTTLTIAAGQRTASFTWTGVAAGTSILTASAANYQTATAAVAVTSNASGKTYYVSNSGLDSNYGTSITTPWKTVAKVNSSVFQAGDQILFESTGVWHEELDVPGAGLRFGAYGAQRSCTLSTLLVAHCTQLPILDGADVISGWVVQSVATYKAPFHGVASKAFVDSLYTQSNPLVSVTSLASVQTTAGTLYSDGNFVYIHLLDGSNPATHTVEISGSRMYGIYIDAHSNTTIDGLEIIRAAKSGILAYDQAAAANNVTIENNVLFNNSDAGKDLTANPNGIVERDEGSIEMQSVYGQTMKNLVIQNNWIGQQDFGDQAPNFFQAGIFALSTTNAIIRNNKVATVHGTGIILGDGFASSNVCTGAIIDRNELTNSEGNIQLSGCTAVQEINNSVHDSFGNCSEAGGGFRAGSTSSQGIWNNNDCHRILSSYNNGLFNGFDNNPVINSTFSNNRISQVAAASISLETTGSVASTGNSLISNVIDSSRNMNYDNTPTADPLSMYVQTGAAGTLTMKGNTFVFGSRGFIRFGASGPINDGHDLSLSAFTQLYPQ